MSWGKSSEKLCPHERRNYKRHLKRKQTKIRRLAEKRDPEEAPKKQRHRGWSI